MKTIRQKMEIRGQHIAPVFLEKPISRFQILGGSREKPLMVEKILGLTNVEHEDVRVDKEVGRVRVITGDYHFNVDGRTGVLRITGGETEMGLSAVDIVQREFIYAADGQPVVQLRSGTSGGNNNRHLEPPVMGLGDIVISKRNIGSSGALEQALGYFRKIIPDAESGKEVARFVRQWNALGGEFTTDNRFLVIENSPVVVKALSDSAKALGVSYHVANTFSKESLYGEDAQEIMYMLRDKYNVLASEMEQLQNAFIAAFAKAKYGIEVLTGMVVAVIGAVPGPGFPDRNNAEQMELQRKTEENGVKIAADALVRISFGLEKKD